MKFVNALIAQGVQDRASDLHFEPQENDFRVRYRIDGVMHEVTKQRRSIHAGVVSRLKITGRPRHRGARGPAGRPGQPAHRWEGDRPAGVEPTDGARREARAPDPRQALGAARLGRAEPVAGELPPIRDQLPEALRSGARHGPTGSGKSTTLYATLNAISNPTVNVVTVDDPVEYQIPGISQVPINPKAGAIRDMAPRQIAFRRKRRRWCIRTL